MEQSTHTYMMQGCLAYPQQQQQQQQQATLSGLYWRDSMLCSSVCLFMTVQIFT